MDRRALFFAVAALLAAFLIPFTVSDLRWVPVAVTVTYMLLAVASFADARSSR
ncbi:MAG: hypothetical protein ACRDV9_05225 [Acidimicrobiia bacterium]